MEFYSKTDRGRVRPHNEDYLFVSGQPVGQLPNVFLLADGMGGYKAGEYASRKAVETVLSELSDHPEAEPVEALKDAISSANRTIFQEAISDETKKGMGTTFVACVLHGMNLLAANVGDSRVYISDDRGLHQVTQDHSYVGELLRSGKIQEEEAKVHPKRHFITRAVGVEKEVTPDFFEEQLRPEARILMCTDGLTDMVSDEEIEAVLKDGGSVSEDVERLVSLANEKGGRDNISVILLEP